MSKLNPDALAELDGREAVQPVEAYMIKWYVIDVGELPEVSAGPFAAWIYENWNDWNEDGELTNGQVLAGALAHWRGQA